MWKAGTVITHGEAGTVVVVVVVVVVEAVAMAMVTAVTVAAAVVTAVVAVVMATMVWVVIWHPNHLPGKQGGGRTPPNWPSFGDLCES